MYTYLNTRLTLETSVTSQNSQLILNDLYFTIAFNVIYFYKRKLKKKN